MIKENKIFWLFFLVSTAIFSLWTVAFYPGIMTSDSVDQWRQASDLRLSDWHPYLHTLYLAFFQRLFRSPFAVAVFQVLATAGFFSYTFAYFWKKNVSKKLLITLFLLFVFSIPIGIYNVTIWKDVPFSLSVIACAFFLAKKYDEKKWTNVEIIMFLIISIGAIFLRHNGLIYILFLPLIVSLYFSEKRFKKYYLSGLLGLFIFFQFFLPKILNLQPNPFWVNNVFVYHSSVGFYSHQPQTKILNSTKDMLEKVLPKKELKEKYNPAYWDPIYWNNKRNNEFFNSSEFWNTIVGDFYSYNLIANLPYFLGDKVNMFLTVSGGFGMNYSFALKKDIETGVSPIVSSFFNELSGLLKYVNGNPFIRFFVWNSFIPILLLMLVFIDSLYKKRKQIQIFAGFLMVQFPFLFILNMAGDWRYFYFYYLSFFILVPMYFMKEYIKK